MPLRVTPARFGSFEQWSWFFGTRASMIWSFYLWLLAGMLAVAGVVGLIIALGYITRHEEPEPR